MRKFVLVSKDFSGLGFALQNEGDKVIVAINPDMDKFKGKKEEYEKFKLVGKGLVPVFQMQDVMARRDKFRDWFFIFDGNHSVEENEQLRKEGFKVGLGGKISYKMENDREWGIKVAESLGIPSPEWKQFKSAEDGIKFLEANPDKSYVFKPNAADESYLTTVPSIKEPKRANENLRTFISNIGINDFVLQERVKGIEVNIEYMCVNGEVKSATLNLEAKRISSEDKGSMCGCSFDVCRDIPLDSKLVEMTISRIKPLIKREKYTGFADINCIIGDNEVYFIEWCWRTGYNAHPNYFSNVSNVDYLNTVADMVEGKYKPNVKRGWGATVTVFVDHPHKGIPIDIPEDIKKQCFIFDAYKEKDTLMETGVSQEILIACGYGNRIKDALEKAYETVSKIDIINIDYRSDALRDDYASSPMRRYSCLHELGII